MFTGDAATKALTIEGLSVSFGANRALRNFAFVVAAGTVHGLIGPNGSGKTTCLNAITGYVRPTSGSIRLGPTEITGMESHQIARRGVARTFQRAKVMPNVSCLENVKLGTCPASGTQVWSTLSHRPLSKPAHEKEAERTAREMLDFVGLSSFAGRMAGGLAWVEEQLLQIARALAMRPSLLLLDEPTAGMGEAETSRVDALIRRVRDEGLTVVLVAHDVGLLMGVSDTVTVVNAGRRIAEGRPSAVQEDPAVVEAYLGRD